MEKKGLKRRIACMTATRADYPRVKSVLREIKRRPNLDLKLIVTGMHLLREFGDTIDLIKRDDFPIAASVPMFNDDDSPYGMAKAAARCCDGMADALNQIKPDILLLTVDRVETLATAQTAALMNIPIAHIQGGEVTGTIDESIRHAVTKLSQIHFPASEDAGQRIIKMGEDPRHVHVVGCPYLDMIRTLNYQTKESLSKKYGFNPQKPLALFTQHPVTTEYGEGAQQIKTTIEALAEFPGIETVALYSNADAGGREIISTLSQLSNFYIFPNIPEEDYLNLMKHASFMIGNSSAGIREAPGFELPAINIGSRQNGRQRVENVIDVPHEVKKIIQAIRQALNPDFRSSLREIRNPYGDGYSAKRIVDILESADLNQSLIQKIIQY